MTVDERRLEAAHAFLQRGVDDGAFGGAVALVDYQGQTVAHWAVGYAEKEPHERPMLRDSIFDLASLTKPVAGASAALLLLEDGVWSLDDAVARFLPEFGVHGKQEITLRHLLTHSSGISGWAATYCSAREPRQALEFLCALQLGYAPGTDVQYSDLGYSLIGHLVRRVTGAGLDRLLSDRVWRPLGMDDTAYCPAAELRERIAATERGNRYEQAMVANLGEAFDGWRDPDVVQVGEVNDGNTFYALGGVSSHAGLFSTASDLLRFGRMYLTGGGGVLSAATIAEATSRQTDGLSKSRGLGWELVGKGRQRREEWAPTAAARKVHGAARGSLPLGRAYGDLLSGTAYGHTGFTGTSMAIDPERELVIILLTNRTHPRADNELLSALRPRFYNMVVASLR
ncbi:MAG TPA: serine hydrolase domain-containing protein [Chloroflexota bacterium]|jgi:CubicO group peptidase (beta-lactamase class C family)|nr:serine hydrolase domain-containing protein [Chloroflexota bacterium]